MPLKIIHPDHLEIVGRGPVLLSNPPRPLLSHDAYTGKIVEEIALLSKAHAIIGKELKGSDSPETRLAKSEFDTAMKRICSDNQIKCVIEIDGKKEPGIQIWTEKSDEGARELIELLRAGFTVDFDLKVTVEETGSNRRTSLLDSTQVISLSLGLEEIGYRRETIITDVADSVGLINARLGYSESPGDTLD